MKGRILSGFRVLPDEQFNEGTEQGVSSFSGIVSKFEEAEGREGVSPVRSHGADEASFEAVTRSLR